MNYKKITYAAMFIAIYVVLENFASWTYGPLRISISTFAIAMSGVFLGPIYGGIIGGICDLIMFFLKNYAFGPYTPGLTLGAILVGVIFGLLVHKRKNKTVWIYIAQTIVTVFVHLGLDTYFLMATYKMQFIPLLISRYPAKLIILPILICIEIAFYEAIKLINKQRKQ